MQCSNVSLYLEDSYSKIQILVIFFWKDYIPSVFKKKMISSEEMCHVIIWTALRGVDAD